MLAQEKERSYLHERNNSEEHQYPSATTRYWMHLGLKTTEEEMIMVDDLEYE
jgi:hypothetical protein